MKRFRTSLSLALLVFVGSLTMAAAAPQPASCCCCETAPAFDPCAPLQKTSACDCSMDAAPDTAPDVFILSPQFETSFHPAAKTENLPFSNTSFHLQSKSPVLTRLHIDHGPPGLRAPPAPSFIAA